jgi:hypothetical protein
VPTCIFCNREATMTLEHATPKWLKDVLPGDGLFYHWRGQPDDGPTWTWTDTWPSDEPDFKVKAVCGECNNVWLSDLEKDAKPVLTPMIHGQPTTLEARDAELVALWAAKTALVFDALDPETYRVARPEHRRELHDTRKPPARTFVWLTATDEESGFTRRAFGYTGSEDALDRAAHVHGQPPPWYCNTLIVGRLVLFPAWLPVEYGQVPKCRGQLARALVRVWPFRSPVVWPPPAIIRRDAAPFLGEMFVESVSF